MSWEAEKFDGRKEFPRHSLQEYQNHWQLGELKTFQEKIVDFEGFGGHLVLGIEPSGSLPLTYIPRPFLF